MYGQKFLRGQVWWIGTSKEYIGTIQSPNRPHVIVSNNVGNRGAGYVMVVPCTSELKRMDMPTHLECEFNGKKNMIMCEQIKTVSVDELLSYMFTFDDNMMNKIDDALKMALGIVDKKSSEIIVEKKEKIEDTNLDIPKEENNEPEINNIVEIQKSKNGKYRVWDLQTKEEYIKCYETKGRDETMKLYDTGLNTRLYYKRFCKSLNIVPKEA